MFNEDVVNESECTFSDSDGDEDQDTVVEVAKEPNKESVITPSDPWTGYEAMLKLGLSAVAGISNDLGSSQEPIRLCVGIDEAGRGALYGPLVYGLSAVPVDRLDDFKKKTCVTDSKKLTHIKRLEIAGKMKEYKSECPSVFWGVGVVEAYQIDYARLCDRPMSLNEISIRCAVGIIKRLESAIEGTNCIIDNILFDALGSEETLIKQTRQIMDNSYPTRAIEKADLWYAQVSAASIWAKTYRDWRVDTNSMNLSDYQCGSGYPGDPQCLAWMRRNFNKVWGFPAICTRFSWKPASLAMDNGCYPIIWNEEEKAPEVMVYKMKKQTIIKSQKENSNYNPSTITSLWNDIRNKRRSSDTPTNTTKKRLVLSFVAEEGCG